MAEPSPLTVGTAGHVDHGKTALVEALTGTNTDRLEEERRRGISIELGFAQLVLPDGRPLSIVDVPGHERFVRTMVAGASGFNLYLLVVAADDGVMPQTREHVAVLRALGVERGVVALTRCDLANASRTEEVANEVRALAPDAPLVMTSVVDGRGRAALVAALAQTAQESAAALDSSEPSWPQPATLHIDRAFSLKGVGTVVTGTLRGSAISRGETLLLLPQGREVRVRSAHVHDRAVERVEPRQRVALNLAGVRRSEVRPGDVVTGGGRGVGVFTTACPSYRADVELIVDSRQGSLDGERVQVHHGTREAAGRIVYLDEAGRFAQLRLESPIIARPRERVVLRSIAYPDTVGGAVIVDPNPRRHGRGQAGEELALIVDGQPSELIASAAATGARIPADPGMWAGLPLLGAALHRHPRQEWLDGIEQLVAQGALTDRDGVLAAPIATDAEAFPEPVGQGVDDRDHAVLAVLAADGPRPRAKQAIADELGRDASEVEGSIGRLCRAGIAVRLGLGVVYEAAEYARLRERLLGLIRDRGGSISVAETRDELSTSRKYAQAWLEHLDGSGATVRRGDRHHLRSRLGRQGSGGPAGLQSQ